MASPTSIAQRERADVAAANTDADTQRAKDRAASTTDTPTRGLRAHTRVLNPAFVTQDFDQLRFEAAAQHQLPSAESPLTTPGSRSGSGSDTDADIDIDVDASADTATSASPAYSPYLISSPYNTPGHHLDLRPLTPASRLFALVLTALAPQRADYATAPYTSALDFDRVLSVLRELVRREGTVFRATSFYVVVFRSQLNKGVDQEWLYKLDYESHREACESGGLLKYWFGRAELEGERRNLATCFWHSREDAHKGGLGPWHAKARAAGRELYESIVFSTHRFTVLDGAEGYRFEDWDG